MVYQVDDSIKVSGFKPLYQFFVKAKSRKQSFFLTFGDKQGQEVMDYRLGRVDYKPAKIKKPGLEDVSLTFVPAGVADFEAVIEPGDKLRIEFYYEGFVNYFLAEVGFVAPQDDGLSFSAKLPEHILAKQRRDMVRIDVDEGSDIEMHVNDSPVRLLNISGGGAEVLMPLANRDELEIGKAIKNMRLSVDDLVAPLNAEVRHLRMHEDGNFLIVGLRFIFFGYNHEDQLLHLVHKRTIAAEG